MKTKTVSLSLFLGLIFCTKTEAQVPENIQSQLVVLDVNTGKEKVILTEKRHFEAPNWSRDGKFLIINSQGFLEKIDLSGENLGKINPETVHDCNNDHGLSFDGKTLIYSQNEKQLDPYANSRIYAIPLAGGPAKRLTEAFPSYWHGVSPDGKEVVYCARRNNAWDIYKIATSGGPEIRLTQADGLDDGPEYSYDGRWIYFNSHRSKRMQLYRMRPDGSEVEQLTYDAFDNWFGHPSPNGQLLAYIAYLEDQQGQHPFGKDVKLRLMDLRTRTTKDLTTVFWGGQGTINVPSWSPDGQKIAFVKYIKL
jgi:TolB protein